MGSTFNFQTVDTGLNLGTYNGGYTSVNGSSARTRNASSVNISRVSRDLSAGYSQNIDIIQKYLQNGDIAQAMQIYEQMSEEAKVTAQNYGYTLTDSQISSMVDNAYGNRTGSSFVQAATQDAKSPFVAGLLQGIPLVGLFAQSYSDAEALSKVTGIETRGVDKAAEYAGSALSGAAVGAVIGQFAIPIPGVGAAIGGVVGGIVGLFQNKAKEAIDKN